MVINFNKLSNAQQCLLVGRVAKMYDAGKPSSDIAEELNRPIELINDVIKIILTVRESDKK